MNFGGVSGTLTFCSFFWRSQIPAATLLGYFVPCGTWEHNHWRTAGTKIIASSGSKALVNVLSVFRERLVSFILVLLFFLFLPSSLYCVVLPWHCFKKMQSGCVLLGWTALVWLNKRWFSSAPIPSIESWERLSLLLLAHIRILARNLLLKEHQ